MSGELVEVDAGCGGSVARNYLCCLANLDGPPEAQTLE